MGGSILWVFSTVLLQRSVEDQFRGRVFAAEMALVTLTMAASNYVVGELIDRGYSPRVVTASVGGFFLLPGLMWFVTQKWWDVKRPVTSSEVSYHPPIADHVRPASSSEADRRSTLSHDPVATAPGSDT
jgi:hypothetical protein